MDADWMNHVKSFRDLLTQELNTLSRLSGLEDVKYEALKQVDISKLLRINNQEEEVLHSMDLIEKKRKDLIVLLSKEFHFNQNVSLNELFTFLPDDPFAEMKIQLTEIRTKIKNMTNKLQVTMQENSEMIRINLEIINLTMNFANRNSQKETYNNRNKKDSRENIYLINQIA